MIALKPENLRLGSILLIPSFRYHDLPSMEDKWNVTDTSLLTQQMLRACRKISAESKTVEQAEREIFITLNQNQEHFECMAFPTLFPYGTGHFGKKRHQDVRFEKHANHLLHYSIMGRFIFMHHDGWIVFTANRAALLQQVTNRPPMWKQGNSPPHSEGAPATALMMLYSMGEEQKAFCFRFLLGDEAAGKLAMLYLRDCHEKRLERAAGGS